MATCGPNRAGPCGRRAEFDFGTCATLADMVGHFHEVRGDQRDQELLWWGDKRLTVEQACERAMFRLGVERGRDAHQRPFSIPQLQAMGSRLAAQAAGLEAAKDFEALRVMVEAALGYRPGGARLLIYDVTQRLGCYLEKAPDQVYLHAGPKVGANNLRDGLGKPHRRPLTCFPTSIRTRLTSAQAEDFLCVARKFLHAGLWD